MNTLIKFAIAALLFTAPQAGALDAFEEPPIRYSEAEAHNAISVLQQGLEDRAVALTYDPKFGYLKSLLQLLNIPQESQLLVFSKTSLQIRHITPESPRAIYFNDDVYIGTVQGGDMLEISATDPELGVVFYTLPQKEVPDPRFTRERHACLQCHATGMTRNLPGHIVRSVFPDANGQPIFKAGSQVTDQDSPFDVRWGGWYIIGDHGNTRHRGNVIAVETQFDATMDSEAGANLMAVPPRVDTDRYLEPHSDIVAMMVLEHQTQCHNLLTQASFETRMALHRQAISDRIFERDPGTLSESTTRIVHNLGDKVVNYMIFAHEVELTDPIQGSSAFTSVFQAAGPRDSQGRSLRTLDLENRLFEYPLSFLIYSAQFDGLPAPVKAYIFQRLWNILTGAESTPDLLHLTNAKCRAVIEIVAETKQGLPEYWVK